MPHAPPPPPPPSVYQHTMPPTLPRRHRHRIQKWTGKLRHLLCRRCLRQCSSALSHLPPRRRHRLHPCTGTLSHLPRRRQRRLLLLLRCQPLRRARLLAHAWFDWYGPDTRSISSNTERAELKRFKYQTHFPRACYTPHPHGIAVHAPTPVPTFAELAYTISTTHCHSLTHANRVCLHAAPRHEACGTSCGNPNRLIVGEGCHFKTCNVKSTKLEAASSGGRNRPTNANISKSKPTKHNESRRVAVAPHVHAHDQPRDTRPPIHTPPPNFLRHAVHRH